MSPPPETLASAWKRRGCGASAHETSGVPFPTRLRTRYEVLCYRLLGQRLDARPHPGLASRLQRSGLGLSPGLYRSMQVATSGLALVATGLVAALLFGLALDVAGAPTISLVVAGATGLATFASFPFVVGTRIQNRASRLDRELPFALSELSVLASIGLSPIELVRRMARRAEEGPMTDEFRRIVHKTDVEGADIVTALAATARESPSEAVRQTLWDLANMIHQGGDLDEYLRTQSDLVMREKRANQKQFVDRLATYAEMYVTLVLLGVMFLGVGAFLLDAFGMTAGGLAADALLMLLAYGILPLVVVVLGIVLSSAHQRAE